MVQIKTGSVSNAVTLGEIHLDLEEISLLQGVRTLSHNSPKTYIDSSLLNLRPVKVQSSMQDMMVEIRGELLRHSFRDDKEADGDWKKHINHLRHDYVGNMLQHETDADLSSIGINTKLTPDYLSNNKRVVIELTTTLSDRSKALERSYKKKILAYSDLLSNKGVFYCILVVSSTQILTNCHLRSDMVSELCRRCREGISMETELEKQLGFQINVGDSDEDENLQHVVEAMELIEKMQKPLDWDFNHDLEEDSVSLLTDNEKNRAKEILDETWRKAYEKKGLLPSDTIETHYKSMRVKSTRMDQKRIFTFPAITPEYTGVQLNELDSSGFMGLNSEDEGSKELAKLWQTASIFSSMEMRRNPLNTHFMTSLSEAMTGETETEQHHMRRSFEFEDDLTRHEMDKIALSGPGAKLRKEMDEIVSHERLQKQGFDPETPHYDILEFLEQPILETHNPDLRTKSSVLNLIRRSHVRMSRRKIPEKLMDWVTETGLVRYGSFITSLCSELSYEYKTPHKDGRWTCKPMRDYPAFLLIRSTGSHIFFSIAFEKNGLEFWDTGRLGSKCWTTDRYVFSDFSSLVEASLEHFIKAGPYLASISAYLMQHFNVPFLTSQITFPAEYWKTLKTMFLIYMNNKNDVEDMVMGMRYLYMRILQKFENDPFTYVEKLPSVFRSRLSCYFMKRIEWIMKYFRYKKPRQVKVHGIPDSDPNSVRYVGLRCIFHDSPLSISQLVDSFYFSYTVSKMKGKVGDRSFKITKKIIQEEMWARENIPAKDGFLWNDIGLPLRQKWSPSLLKMAIDTCSSKWKAIMGDNYVDQIHSTILRDFSRRNFSEIATLKASSRDHSNPQINLPKRDLGELTGKQYVEELKSLNPKLKGKRPRVISSLLNLIRDYMKSTGDEEPTLIKLLPFSMRDLISRGYIFSDCFPKDQHGGDREIHILEIRARILQFFVERMAACMSNLFRTDSILNPSYKDSFMRNHEISAQANLGDHMTMCKSADASKWCQRHHVSKFYFMMNRITGGKFSTMLYNTFFLWTVKRIAIPSELIGILHTSTFPESDNTTLIWLREKFLSGTTPFICEDSDTVEIKFGMWQGIWHRVSSVFHSMFQNAFADWIRGVLTLRRIPSIVSVIQGSDDSACVISFNKKDKFTSYIIYCILKWKEIAQEYISIWPSEAKSSIGTLLLVEYNSEWWYRGKVIKPTFRWVSACLETTIVEMFYERVQIFYNQLSTSVETGLCTLTASIIQRCQAWLHYSMMGFHNHILRDFNIELLIKNPNPSLGYFPLESEVHCGLTGFDYSLYDLNRRTGIPVNSYDSEMINPMTMLDYDDNIDKSLRRDLRTISIQFGDKKIWERIKDELDIGELEDAINLIKKDPSRLYEERSTWEDQRLKMIMKIFEKGVRASLSSYQPTIRSAVSSSYLMNRPCLRYRSQEGKVSDKISLTRALIRLDTERTRQSNSTSSDYSNSSHKITKLFINELEYSDFYDYCEQLMDGFSFQEVPYGRHSKVSIPVWGEMFLHETPLYDIVRRGLFQMRSVSVSQTVFDVLWSECKAKFRFLKNNYTDTLIASGLDDLSLHDFFLSMSGKTRKITLQDTTVKSPDILSAMTRIYWPQVKIRSRTLSIEESMRISRHMLMCILSFPFSESHKLSLLKGLVRISGLKDAKLSDVPVRTRKFKVMLDYVLNNDKKTVIRDIPLIKLGVIGFFIKKQPTKMGTDGKIIYYGVGTWVGQVCGTSVKLDILGQELKSITVSILQDTVNLSKRLQILMRDLRLKPSKKPMTSKSLYYLNSKGHLSVSPIAIQDCVPIELDSTLRIVEFEEVLNREWRFVMERTTLRLCLIEVGKDGREFFVTLLSDTFSSRDWNPSMTPSKMDWTKSKIFPSYCRGEPIRPLDLLEELKLVPDSTYMLNLLSRMGENDVILGKYSMRELGECINRRVVLTKAKEIQKEAYMENLMNEMRESSKTTNINPEEMEEMLNFEVPMSEQISDLGKWASVMVLEDDSKESWADIVELEESENVNGGDDEEIEEAEWKIEDSILEEISDMFFKADLEDMNIEYSEFELMKDMPEENSFWDDIIKMCESESDGPEILDSIMSAELKRPDMRLLSQSAFYFSLALRKNLYPIPQDQMTSEQESLMSRETSEKIYSKELLQSKIEELESEISQISDVLEGLPEVAKKILKDQLDIKMMRLSGLRGLDNDILHDNLNYWSFMDQIIRILKENEIWDKTDQSSDLETLITLLLSQCLESSVQNARLKFISENELNSIRTRVWDRIVSTTLMRLISSSFSLSTEFLLDGRVLFEYEPKFSSKSVTFRLRNL